METYFFRIYSDPLNHNDLECKRWDPRLDPTENLFYQLELSKEELQRLVPKLKGRPTFYEHMDNHPDYEPLPIMQRYGIQRESWGYIVRAEQDPSSGSVYVYVKPFDTLGGCSMAAKLQARSGIKGCSLQHTRDMIYNQVWANEVSSCEEGKRPKTFFLGTVVLPEHEDLFPTPLPTTSSEVLDNFFKADLNDLPYVLKRSPIFDEMLPRGMRFRTPGDFNLLSQECAHQSKLSIKSGPHNFSPIVKCMERASGERETYPPLVFSKASLRPAQKNSSMPLTSGRPHSKSGFTPNKQVLPFSLTQSISLLLTRPFFVPRNKMSVNAKASLQVPLVAQPLQTTPVQAKASSLTSNEPNPTSVVPTKHDPSIPHSVATENVSTVAPVQKVDVSSAHPAALPSTQNIVSASEPNAEKDNATGFVRSENTVEDVSMKASISNEEQKASDEIGTADSAEQPMNTDESEDDSTALVQSLAADAWDHLPAEQRPRVQAMLNALQNKHLKASNKLRKELSSKEVELKKWRAAKEAQDKKSIDDFMSSVLKVVSQTTDAQTQACLQQALDSMPNTATVAEKASAFLPFVAQAQIMTAKSSKIQAPTKKSTPSSSRASSLSGKKSTQSSPSTVGLGIAANRNLTHPRKLNQRSSNSSSESLQPARKKQRGSSEGFKSNPKSIGFVFNSALKNSTTTSRQNKFIFD